MDRVVPDVSDLQTHVFCKLLLDVEIPPQSVFVQHLGVIEGYALAQVSIDTQSVAHGHLDSRGKRIAQCSGRCQVTIVGGDIGSGCAEARLLWGHGTVVVVENTEPAPYDRSVVERLGRPGDADTGSKCLVGCGVGAAIAPRGEQHSAGGKELARGKQRTRALGVCRFRRLRDLVDGGRVETDDLPVVTLRRRRGFFPAQTQVESQVRSKMPVILHE